VAYELGHKLLFVDRSDVIGCVLLWLRWDSLQKSFGVHLL